MVYISNWQDYHDAAEALYAKSPSKARYCVKWRVDNGAAQLVLKITDDTTCLKFKTHSSVFLNRFEALNLSLMQKMQNASRLQQPEQPASSAPAAPAVAAAKGSEAAAGSTGTGATPSAGGPPASGGVKKKKPKKKK